MDRSPQTSRTDYLMQLNQKIWGFYKQAEEHSQQEKEAWERLR